MAIRVRRGLKADFDPSKLLSGEPAVPLDTREVYMAFAPGDVQKLATHENVKEMVEEATDEVIADFTEGVNNATEYATEQGDYAKEQGNHAKTQGDYAKEQGDYAKAQGQAAESIVLGNIATETTPGIVRGGGDVKVDPVTGDMTAPDKLDKTGDSKDNTVTFAQATADGELTSGSTHATLFGLIKKKLADILTALAGKIDKTSIAQTTEVNDSTKVPSTAVTHGMQQNIVKNANDIGVLNNNLENKMSKSYNGTITNNYKNTVEENWNNMPVGISMCKLVQGSEAYALIGKTSNVYGATLIIGYGISSPIHGLLQNGVWTWKTVQLVS